MSIQLLPELWHTLILDHLSVRDMYSLMRVNKSMYDIVQSCNMTIRANFTLSDHNNVISDNYGRVMEYCQNISRAKWDVKISLSVIHYSIANLLEIIRTVQELRISIEKLTIHDCIELSDDYMARICDEIDVAIPIPMVFIYGCNNLTIMPKINCTRLEILWCQQLRNIAVNPHVQHAIIHQCGLRYLNIDTFPNAMYMKVSAVPYVAIPSKRLMIELIIEYAHMITGVENLHADMLAILTYQGETIGAICANSVYFRDCRHLKNICVSTNNITIERCWHLTITTRR